jgi:protein-arginine kinase activator protein McsA
VSKVCTRCEVRKDLTSFHKDKSTPDGLTHVCKECQSEYAKSYRKRNRQKIKEKRRKFLIEQRTKAIKYKGGKCARCGYNDLTYLRVFQFHHLDPNEKEVVFSFASNTFETYKEELDKCILLCANCHMAVHDGADITGKGGTCGG